MKNRKIKQIKFKKTVKRRGRKFNLVGSGEPIQSGAIHTLDGKSFSPLMNDESVGDIPANVNPGRAFYNPVKTSRKKCRERELERARRTEVVTTDFFKVVESPPECCDGDSIPPDSYIELGELKEAA